MSALLNSLNVHYLPIFQPILIIFVSKFIVHRAISDKPYLSLGLLSPLMSPNHLSRGMRFPTMWYVRPSKAHQPAHTRSLIRAYASCLNIL